MEKTWTVLELVQWTTGFLKQKGIENGRREAEDLLGQVLELDRLKLYLAFEDQPGPLALARFRELVARRAKREPLQYLLGWQPFLGMKIKCAAGVLIPRPETERLAQLALERLAPLGEAARFADIGTGTGCIALALAQGSAASGMATDLSEAALSLAAENARALGLAERIEFLLGNLCGPLEGAFDLIVSNPPYIAESDKASLQPEVRDFEPGEALFSGPDGLRELKQLLNDAPRHLKPGGWLMLECGKGQPELLKSGLNAGFSEARIEADPYGVERFLILKKS